MGKKLLLQDLADALAERGGVSKRKAEMFSRAVFDVIMEGLTEDSFVKVKGFGTFKIVEVGERESVNISTGQRFQINGHNRVVFTPDNALKDLVNRPFSQFQTVVINEGTDLAEMEKVGDEPLPEEESEQPEKAKDERLVPVENGEETTAIEADAQLENSEAKPESKASGDSIVLQTENNDSGGVSSHAESTELPDGGDVGKENKDYKDKGNDVPPPVPQVLIDCPPPIPAEVAVARERVDSPPQPPLENPAEEPQSAVYDSSEKPTEAAGESEGDTNHQDYVPTEVVPEKEEENANHSPKQGEEEYADVHVDSDYSDSKAEEYKAQEKDEDNTIEAISHHGSKEGDDNEGDDGEDDDGEGIEERPARRRRMGYRLWRFILIFLLLIVLMLLSYFAGYFRILCPCGESTSVPPKVQVAPNPASAVSVAKKPDKATADSAEDKTEKQDTAAVAETAETPPKSHNERKEKNTATKPASKQVGNRSARSSRKYKYVITGTRQEYIISQGETIRSIAEHVYGSKGYADYIVRHNNLKNPNMVKTGMIIKLPELERADSSASN